MTWSPSKKRAARSPPNGAACADGSCDSTLHVLERAQRGDRAAINVLIERAQPVVRRWARGRLPASIRGEANTEDVVQDAMLATLKNIANFQYRTVTGLQAYLRTSVISRIRDLIRRTQRQGVSYELDEHVRDTKPSPLDAAIRRQGLDRFLTALQHLRPSDRQVIVWRVELGYSVEEIATRLGKSTPAAGMTVTRAMTRLAKQLGIEER